MKKEDKNLKLYPKYRQLSMDFLFFYTINVLFLTQVKHINMSAVLLVDTFYALFVIMCTVPASIIVGKIGRKKGMILGNLCNIIYLILVMNSTNLLQLILAEITCALAFGLKDIAEPSILNASINYSNEEKSNIFAKIQGKAVSGYYVLSAISLILSGFLYEINGYIPISLTLTIVIITLIISTRFQDVKEISKVEDENNLEVSLKEAIKFAFSSKRCKSLLIFSAVCYSIITVLGTYEISLLEDLGVSSKYIGIMFAILNIVSSISSKKQNIFQNKFKNRTLTILGILLSLSCVCAGIATYFKINILFVLTIILIMYMIKYAMVGLYNVLLIKYLSNFTNSSIDTRIFAINNFLSSVLSVIFGLFASCLLNVMEISMAMVMFGTISLLIIIFILLYMRKRVGLEPKQYSELELKYEVKL